MIQRKIEINAKWKWLNEKEKKTRVRDSKCVCEKRNEFFCD